MHFSRLIWINLFLL